jgi:hypothetical protein
MKVRVMSTSLSMRKSSSFAAEETGILHKDEIVNTIRKKKVGSSIWYCIDACKWIPGSHVMTVDGMTEIELKPSMKLSRIQEILANGKYLIHVLPGNYKIGKTTKLYSNTVIDMEEGASFIRCCEGPMFLTAADAQVSYNYNALQNLTICGKGFLVGNGVKKNSTTLSLFHASNINILDVSFKNTYMSHGIDMGAVRNVMIDGVDFSGRVINPDAPYKEEIQYDYAYVTGIPYYPANSEIYNGNHCKDITIQNCNFKDANCCIGTHTETNSLIKHENITVRKCTAKGVGSVGGYGSFLKMINIDGGNVDDNDISEFARAIEINSCSSFYKTNGSRVTDVPDGKTGCCNVEIIRNRIHDAKGNYKASGLFISSEHDDILHDQITVAENTFDLNNPAAVYDVYAVCAENIVTNQNTTKLKIKIQ